MPLQHPTPFEFVSSGLTKEQFLATNRAELVRLLGAVNLWLEQKHGATFTALTAHDTWVLLYCEAGLTGSGLVDPHHRHSLGERGLLPLPQTVRNWNGPDAPAWDQSMPLAQNLEHFLRYLGQLKNKEARRDHRMSLYRDLFTVAGIRGNGAREAQVLAGVVHGYFYPGNYRDRSIPFDALIEGFKSDADLAQMLRGTTYTHAGTPIIDGRKRNVDRALQLLAA